MIPVHHVNTLNFLQGKLQPNDLRAVGAFLQGDLSRAKALITGKPTIARDSKLARDDYEPPKDDVSKGLGNLMEFLKGCMKPDDFNKAQLAISELMKLSKQRIEDHHAALNEAASEITADDPPDFPGKPIPGGGKAMDSLRARLRAVDRAADTAHRNLRRHMSRIGNL